MGKVQETFGIGSPGAVSRSVDEVVISVKNASEAEIPFGAPVFLSGSGAAPFSVSAPQDFSSFLGFAVRVADKTPDVYPSGQFGENPEGAWQPGDVVEVLVRGGIAVKTGATGPPGGKIDIRKSDGKLTPEAGESGTTVLLENVRIRNPRNAYGPCCEVIVNERNVI